MSLFGKKFVKETKSLVNSFKYAFRGIYKSFASERNMKIHYLAMMSVIALGLYFNIKTIEWIVCLILFSLVIGAEMINTAIENVVDLVTKDKHPLAENAKDVAAGAVLVFAIMSIVVGVIIFLPYILKLFA